jgi:hypothetical protein
MKGSKGTVGRLIRRTAIVILVAAIFIGCKNTAVIVPTKIPTSPATVDATLETPPSDAFHAVGFAFPTEIEPARRYIFYLHGKIIEDQGIPAISPEYGEYRYVDILKVLQSYDFVVVSEQRSNTTNPTEYALRVVNQINTLLDSQVPPESITVVGASKGAAIAMLISDALADSEVNYVLLGACNPPTVDELIAEGISLSGNVLAIYDVSDEYAGSCEGIFSLSEGNRLGHTSQLVVHVGRGHGILYEPLSEWVDPTVKWANQEW